MAFERRSAVRASSTKAKGKAAGTVARNTRKKLATAP
jgi:hypothetical protein